MAADKNCGTCHWRHWVPDDRQWQCRRMECAEFGKAVAEADNPWCPTWAEGKQLGTPLSQMTQARFEEIGRSWGYE